MPTLYKTLGASDRFLACVGHAHGYMCVDGVNVVCIECVRFTMLEP